MNGEEAFVRGFILPDGQQRCLSLLSSRKREPNKARRGIVVDFESESTRVTTRALKLSLLGTGKCRASQMAADAGRADILQILLKCSAYNSG